MEFAILIIINICMGVIFYLVISLKLEKSASDFREKRLHQEMDKIIKEFNITAERNISPLENRIKVMKNLLKQSGDIESIDVTVGEENELKHNTGHADFVKDNRNRESETGARASGSINRDMESANAYNAAQGSLFSRIVGAIVHMLDPLGKKRGESISSPDAFSANEYTPVGHRSSALPKSQSAKESIIEKEYDDILHFTAKNGEGEVAETIVDEEDILNMIQEDMDVYTIISVLNKKGLEPDEISRYVGMPAGEIKLVLNLNNSK